jgi:hypothetical protein
MMRKTISKPHHQNVTNGNVQAHHDGRKDRFPCDVMKSIPAQKVQAIRTRIQKCSRNIQGIPYSRNGGEDEDCKAYNDESPSTLSKILSGPKEDENAIQTHEELNSCAAVSSAARFVEQYLPISTKVRLVFATVDFIHVRP